MCSRRNKIKKGDRVIIYLPNIPEAAIAMLACARIGAVHSVVFGGFSDGIRGSDHRQRRDAAVVTAGALHTGGRDRPVEEKYR
jgi:acetyl-CoA synthetase